MTSTTDKKHLRRLGHKLKPVVTISSKGLTNAVNAEIDRALSDHELIKVKLSAGDRTVKKNISYTNLYVSKCGVNSSHRKYLADFSPV